MSDAEFRFALQARVDLVPTRSVLRRWNERGGATCRQPTCNHDETLPHVLQHCPGNSRAIDGRHDRVLAMIKKAVEPIVSKPSSQVTARFDAYVEGLPGQQLRPDIQIFDAGSRIAHICDLAITFEAQKTDDPAAGSMRVRHSEKLAKYQRAKEFLETLGWRVHVSALVYGALGSVMPSNYKVLTEQLRLTKRNAKQLNRRISVACVQASYKIWRLHSGEINQGDTSRNPGTSAAPNADSRPSVTSNRDTNSSSTVLQPNASSASRSSASISQSRRTWTRWGPSRSQMATTPVVACRTRTRWEPRRVQVNSSSAPDVRSSSRQTTSTQTAPVASRGPYQPRSRSTRHNRGGSRQQRRNHTQVRADSTSASRN